MECELWLKRRNEERFDYIKNISYNSCFYELNCVDDEQFSEAIIIQRINGLLKCIAYKKYENKVLRKK